MSSRCALKCPHCFRTQHPESFSIGELGVEFFEKNFTQKIMSEHVLRMTFSGGVGDPIYNKHLPEIVDYLKKKNDRYQQVIVTNGSYRSESWWKNLLSTLTENDEIIFSIDGWDQESNTNYRVGSSWDSIMMAVELAVQSRALVRWSTIVFKFNQAKLDTIKKLAENKKVDSFHYVFSDRFGNNDDPLKPSEDYIASIPRTIRHKINFKTNKEKFQKSRDIFKTIEDKQSELFSKSSLIYKNNRILPSCTYGYRGSYIDVEGYYYPCSWISHPFPKQPSPIVEGKEQVYWETYGHLKERVNLKKYSLAEVLNHNFWKNFKAQWSDKKNCPVPCEMKCYNNKNYIETLKPSLISDIDAGKKI